VSAENWRNVSLSDVLSAQLEVYAAGRQDRISLSGPAVACTPNVALALGMVVHELATNAAKYGALSSPFGRVTVNWEVDEQATEASTLRIRWIEKGGPTTVAPERQGFGTQLVRRELEHVLRGTAELTFTPTGLDATLVIPFKQRQIVQLEEGPPARERSAT
jgi:two-component sensor histidine kinase